MIETDMIVHYNEVTRPGVYGKLITFLTPQFLTIV